MSGGRRIDRLGTGASVANNSAYTSGVRYPARHAAKREPSASESVARTASPSEQTEREEALPPFRKGRPNVSDGAGTSDGMLKVDATRKRVVLTEGLQEITELLSLCQSVWRNLHASVTLMCGDEVLRCCTSNRVLFESASSAWRV